jgi:predicted Fe-Mo cluster-binding NifX family protein
MRVAIPIWEGRVSPVMDTAGRLLVVAVDGDQVEWQKVFDIRMDDASGCMKIMTEQQIDLLICGAISRRLEQTLASSGIEVIPWFRGAVREIIAAHLKGRLNNDDFFLPGRGRRHRGRRKGHRTGRQGGFRRPDGEREIR